MDSIINTDRLTSKAVVDAGYGSQILGKTITIVRTADLRPGDTVIKLNVINIGYEEPLVIKRIFKITDTFYDIDFVGKGTKELPRFAFSCLFGRISN